MTQMPVEANVVLTANNSQYDQSMQASANTTQALASAVDSLADKISRVTKSAGHTMLGIAGVDAGVIAGATAAWASYEHQMSRLNAQSAIVTRTTQEQSRTMQAYTNTVNNLRAAYGSTTTEAAALVESISKITQNQASPQQLQNLSNTFTQMSKATGESSTGLASSVLNLQKIMGTQVGGATTKKYADQITYLSQQTGQSAQGLTDFAAQIGPIGRLLHLNQTEIMGVSTAFTQAGQDGYQAANAFSKIVTDIAYATQTGSPDLNKYANLVGMTTDKFKDLSGSEKILTIFDRLNSMGPRAITELNRLGLDGMRTMRAITAMSNQTGGLRSAIGQATEGLHSDATTKGAHAAMEGMTDELSRIHQQVEMIAESFAERFGPAVTKVLQGVESMTEAFRKMMEGPLGDVAQAIALIGGTVAAAAGSLMSLAGPLAQMATVALVLRGAGAMGIKAGFRGGSTIAEGDPLVPGGKQASWFQRGAFNTGVYGGRGAAGVRNFVSERLPQGFFGSSRDPLWQRAAAGGLNATAWSLRNMIQPIYSPLTMKGFADPAERTRIFNDARTPWGRGWENFRNNFGGAYTERTTGRSVAMSPGMWSMDRGVSLFDKDVRVTDEGRVTSSNAGGKEQIARTAVIREAGAMSVAFANAGRAAGEVAGAMSSAAVNTMRMAGMGVGKAAGWALKNPMMLGIGALMAGSAAGVDSNALTFGATGLMVGGGIGGGIGAAAGVGMDIYQQHKDFTEHYDAARAAVRGTGTPSEMYAAGQATTADWKSAQDLFKRGDAGIPIGRSDIFGSGVSWGQAYGIGKLGVESIFTGKNQYAARRDAAEQVQRNNQDVAGAFTALASAQGTPIQNFQFNNPRSWQQLDEVLQRVTPAMDKLGVTSGDVVKAWSEGGDSWKSMMSQLVTPGEYTGLWDRIKGLNDAGAEFISDPLVRKAIRQPENINAQYQAINAQYAGDISRGLNYQQILHQRGNIMASVGDDTAPEYQLNAAVVQQVQQALAYQQPFMSRVGGYQRQAQLFGTQAQLMAGDPHQQEKMDAATGQFMQATVGQVQYFQQLLLQQREFNVSRQRSQEDFEIQRSRMDYQYNLQRQRAQDDFDQQRKWAEQDYEISRERAEEQYDISRTRAIDSFYRQMHYSEQNYQIQRRRAEEDHQHQIVMMTEQTAQQQLNIYQRTEVQRTTSGDWLLNNAQDQLEQMQVQEQNLNRLRGMGLSKNAIQQLGFTDPQNAQQLARFVEDAANDPELIQQMNAAIRKRLNAARSLVTDQSSRDWNEFERQYNLATRRGQNDFERSMRQSRREFNISLDQMADDFQRSMDNNQQDYERMQDRQLTQFTKGMDRQEEDYKTQVNNMVDDFGRSMDRAQADMNRMAHTISGSMMDILTKASTHLHGASRKQAQEVLETFETLDTKLGSKGVDIMISLSKIFGFDYHPPKGYNGPSGGGGGSALDNFYGPTGGASFSGPSNPSLGGLMGGSHAAGGVLPGYTPTTDVHHYHSATGGDLHLSGGEAIMVPEWTKAVGGPGVVAEMNRKARNQSFWMGGVMPLPGASSISRHDSGYSSDIWAGDLNWPGRADYGKPIVAYQSGRAHPFDYGSDTSYGRGVMIAGSGGRDTLYAHMSAIMAGIAGKMVRAGQTIGYVGDYGNTGTPPTSHLHFELKQGGWNLPFTDNYVSRAGGGGGGGIGSILKAIYPGVEKASSDITLGGGPFPRGGWSKRLNQYAHEAIRRLVPRGQRHPAGGAFENFGGDFNAEGSNQDIVRSAMHSFGWNQWPSLYKLVMSESGFNNTAQNPTSSAYGMFQFLDSTWAGVGGHKTSDSALQALYGMRYIKNRYTDPKGAWDFHTRNGWYGDGSIFTGPKTIGVGERGPEAVIPLNERGAEFIASIIAKSNAGTEAKQGLVQGSTPIGGHHYYNYNIDRSTTFSGNITVQANDPNQFITQLRARERVRALTQPSIGGARV